MFLTDNQANGVIDYGENEAEITLASAAEVGYMISANEATLIPNRNVDTKVA